MSSLRCTHCGYLLTGQRRASVCPECAHPVEASMQAADDWRSARRVRSFRFVCIALGVAAVTEAQFAAILWWMLLSQRGAAPLWTVLLILLHFVGLVTACCLSAHASARRPKLALLIVSVLVSIGMIAMVTSLFTFGLRHFDFEHILALLFAFHMFCLCVIAWTLGVNARSRGHGWTRTRCMIVAVLTAIIVAWSVAGIAWQSPNLNPATFERTVLTVATLDVVLVLVLATIAMVLMARRNRPV